MNIPNKLKIGWKQYDVKQKKIDKDLVSNYTELYGQILFDEQKIYINDAYGDMQKCCTLIHESVHGMDDMYSIGLSEKQVEQLGNAFYAFIQDNTELFKVHPLTASESAETLRFDEMFKDDPTRAIGGDAID